MRALAIGIVSLVACGHDREPEREPPAPRPAPPAASRPPFQSSKPIDLRVVDGTPFALRRVQVLAIVAVDGSGRVSRDAGVIGVDYVVEGVPPAAIGPSDWVSVLTTCRVHEINLAMDREGGFDASNLSRLVAGDGRAHGTWRSDPFREWPKLCQLDFRLHRDGGLRTVATACYRDGDLAAGACPAGSFPPPAGGEPVTIASAKSSFADHNVGVFALFTYVRALEVDRTLGGDFRCDADGKLRTSKRDEDTLSFAANGGLPAGTTEYASLDAFLGPGPGTPTRCELRLVARTKTGPAKPLAMYCLAGGGATPGACNPPLPKR